MSKTTLAAAIAAAVVSANAQGLLKATDDACQELDGDQSQLNDVLTQAVEVSGLSEADFNRKAQALMVKGLAEKAAASIEADEHDGNLGALASDVISAILDGLSENDVMSILAERHGTTVDAEIKKLDTLMAASED